MVIVPALIIFAGFPLVTATGTSLAAILLPVGILGVIAYHKAGKIDFRAAAFIAGGLFLSVAAGAWLANALPAGLMKTLYALFCIYVSWTFIDPVKRLKAARSKAAGSEVEEPETIPRAPASGLAGTGLLAGLMSGLFGIGGGNIIVPVLTLAFRFPAKRAIATSLATLLLPMGLPGVLYYAKAGTLDLRAAAWIAAGLFIGTVFGAKLTISLPTSKVKLFYGLFLLFVAFRFLFF